VTISAEARARYEARGRLKSEIDAILAARLTPASCYRAVDIIEALAEDDEAAHVYEDRLHQAVLLQIANGSLLASAIAAIALKTRDIKFARWCA
jgi:DNA-binding GntR family transcriptional regulator